MTYTTNLSSGVVLIVEATNEATAATMFNEQAKELDLEVLDLDMEVLDCSIPQD